MLRGKCIKDIRFEENDQWYQWHQQQQTIFAHKYIFSLAAEFAHIIQKGVFTSTAPKLEQMIPSCIQSLKLFFFVPSNVAFLYFVLDFSTLHAPTNCDQHLVCLPRTCFPITGEWNKAQWSLKSKGYIRQPPRSIWISPNLVEPAWLWYSGGTN